MPSINSKAPSPGLQRLFAANAEMQTAVASLTARDVELLTVIARGERDDEQLSRHRAIAALPTAAAPEIAMPVLDYVVRDPAAPRTAKVTALQALGRLGTRAAQEALLQRVNDADPRVQQATFAALGQFADPSALTALERVTASDAAGQQQLLFTRVLIAHRFGVAAPRFTGTRGRSGTDVTGERALAVALEIKSVEATAADLSRFRGPAYGISLAERAYRLQCGRAEWTIFVNRELGTLAVETLLARPWIAALVARWLPLGKTAATQYVVLCRPVADSVQIDVARADGEVIYTGNAKNSGTGLSFVIVDSERPGAAPTYLAGQLSVDGAQLGVANVSRDRIAPRRVAVSTTPSSKAE